MDRQKLTEELHRKILLGADAQETLWETIIAMQGEHFYTSTGLPFSYTVKRKKNGDYSGELLISRKEESKTLTRSSVMLAFRKVLEAVETETTDAGTVLVLPFYKGSKAIGQIFGISYIYSLFWRLGLIQVPEKVEKKLMGKEG